MRSKNVSHVVCQDAVSISRELILIFRLLSLKNEEKRGRKNVLLLKILQFSFYFLMTFDLAIDLYCLGVILVYMVRPPPALSIEFKVPAKF